MKKYFNKEKPLIYLVCGFDCSLGKQVKVKYGVVIPPKFDGLGKQKKHKSKRDCNTCRTGSCFERVGG